MIQELGLTAGYRYSDYTTNGNGVTNTFDADTYFAGLSWAPNDDIRFRLNQSVAIRAPNVFDLYVGINTGLVELTPVAGDGDQCAGTDPLRLRHSVRTLVCPQLSTEQSIQVLQVSLT